MVIKNKKMFFKKGKIIRQEYLYLSLEIKLFTIIIFTFSSKLPSCQGKNEHKEFHSFPLFYQLVIWH